MDFNPIFADPEGDVTEESKRFVLAAEYSKEELLSFGLFSTDVDFDEEYFGKDELTKLRELWTDTLYLSDLYNANLSKFDDPYWHNITEEEFITDTIASAPHVFKELESKFNDGTIDDLFESLHKNGDARGGAYSVKSKFGKIKRRYAFRIYAIKIDIGCYIITGGTIKLTKTMQGERAYNTKIELKKINHVFKSIGGSDIDNKGTFFDFILE